MLGSTADIPRLVARVPASTASSSASRTAAGRLPIEELLQAKLAGVRVEDATHHLRADHRQDPGRRPASELADLLRWLSRVAADARRKARRRHRAGAVGGPARHAADGADGARDLARIRPTGALPPGRASARTAAPSRSTSSARCAPTRSTGTPVWAQDRDDRVTRVGRVIRNDAARRAAAALERAARRHELRRSAARAPVLRRAARARRFPFYQQRHAVKPGLTGWAQVKYRYGASVEDAMEKLRYDLYYIKHLSLVLRPDDRLRHGQGHPVRQGGRVSAALRPSARRGTDPAPRCPIARNVGTRYLAIAAEAVLGLVILPFNLAHLGQAGTACGCSRPRSPPTSRCSISATAARSSSSSRTTARSAMPRRINEIAEHAVVRVLHRGRAPGRGCWRSPSAFNSITLPPGPRAAPHRPGCPAHHRGAGRRRASRSASLAPSSTASSATT